MKSAVAIFFCLYVASGFAQSKGDTMKPIQVINGNIVDFTIDNLGNVYTLDKANQLKKLNVNGDSVAVFNDVRRYGLVYSIDATNPLKLLLYYKDFGTVVMLDRFLNARSTINLRNLNMFQVKAICQSYDNGVWIYDELDARLKKLNDEGNITDQSSDFRLFMDAVPSPVQLVDQDRLVYMYDTLKGLFVFDYYGALKNKVALQGWSDFQVVAGNVFGRKNTLLLQYKPGTLNLKEEMLSNVLHGVEKIRISINRLYCLKKGSVVVYAF